MARQCGDTHLQPLPWLTRVSCSIASRGPDARGTAARCPVRPPSVRLGRRDLFFQLVNRRYERGSLLITTNQRVSEWGTVFGDEVLATAILDRLLHHSHRLMITARATDFVRSASRACSVRDWQRPHPSPRDAAQTV